MKYHWIDYPHDMPLPSGRLDPPFLHTEMMIRSSTERFRQ